MTDWTQGEVLCVLCDVLSGKWGPDTGCGGQLDSCKEGEGGGTERQVDWTQDAPDARESGAVVGVGGKHLANEVLGERGEGHVESVAVVVEEGAGVLR